MTRLTRNLSTITKHFSDRKNMWIIFAALWANMILMTVSLLFAAKFTLITVGLGSIFLAVGLLVWRQLFHNIVAIGIVSSGIKSDLTQALERLKEEQDEISRQKKEVRKMTLKANLAGNIQHQVEDELKYLKEFAGQTKTSLFKMADSIDIELQENIQSITLQAEKANDIAALLTQSAKIVGGKSDNVAEGATRALNNTTNVQQSAERLTAAVEEITRQMEQTTELTAKAVTISNDTRQTISGLEDAAQGIGEIISLINNIAHQTNLLALNATIESARAGDAGKGFGVVAAEVKELARQTTRSIEEITKHVDGIQARVSDAVTDIEQIKTSIDNVQASSDIIRKEVSRQGEATQNIANSVAEARQSVETVTDGARDISREASSNATIVEEINQISEKLAIQVLSIRNNMMDIVQCALAANERRSAERFMTSATSTITLEGHSDVITIQIMDYSTGGMQMKLLDPAPLNQPAKGRISTGDSGAEINFTVCSMQGDIISARFDDEAELIQMFNAFLHSQDDGSDHEDVMADVELFG
ncbi:MAG: hypothetical protein GXP02_10070 [Alphaproteobacteria bacterium]|nr:hypothetical protein [Alphaproteobacteria bacterium]